MLRSVNSRPEDEGTMTARLVGRRTQLMQDALRNEPDTEASDAAWSRYDMLAAPKDAKSADVLAPEQPEAGEAAEQIEEVPDNVVDFVIRHADREQ